MSEASVIDRLQRDSGKPVRRSIVFGTDQGMVLFLAFLVLAIVFLPMITLSRAGRLGLSFMFASMLLSGALATIRHRSLAYVVIGLTVSTLAVSVTGEFAGEHSFPAPLETSLRLICLSILVILTLRRTLRSGPINVYRVLGGIAGYLLIGYLWTFAYQLVVQQVPDAIHIGSVAPTSWQQPAHLVYFSFITLTTVGYGDTYPVHPVVRSLAVAEALVGQLYLATLIASLVGMAFQTRSFIEPGIDSGPKPG